MPEKYRRNFMKSRDTKTLLDEVTKQLKTNLEQMLMTRINAELVETEFANIFIINGKPLLAKVGEDLFPTLAFSQFLDHAPRAIVDMGAVPYVCKGANIMRPGIRHFEGVFLEDDFVLVVDEKYGKSLAMGKTLLDKNEAEKATQGAIVRNVHFVGDRLWNFLKELT